MSSRLSPRLMPPRGQCFLPPRDTLYSKYLRRSNEFLENSSNHFCTILTNPCSRLDYAVLKCHKHRGTDISASHWRCEMLHFISEWGAIVVGILAAAFIVIGACAALSSTADTTQSNMVNRVFAFGTGAFFTAVCLDFLPDAWSGTGETAPYWIFAGSFVMWAATHLSDGLFDRNQNQHLAASTADISEDARSKSIEQFQSIDNALDGALRFTPVSAIVLAAALSFHTFLEGAAVSLAFQDLNFKTIGF